MYNGFMSDFNFFCPIDVRYGDLDPQGHVNNAAFITYLEQARVAYIRHLGLWDGKSFLHIGFILARVELDYKAPIQLTDRVEVGVRTSRLGTKSLDMEYLIQELSGERVYGEGRTVQVAYDYQRGITIPLQDSWRDIIGSYEGIH
jgi:acyl-CoA thioester hydrolase